MKRFLTIGLALTVLGTTSIPAFAATTTTTNGTSIESSVKNNTITKDSYISWFNEKIKKSNGSEKADLKTSLSQFKALTKEKQDKFIGYINNPEIIANALNASKQEVKKSALTTLSSSSQSTNKVFNYNDDIKVTVSSTVEDNNKSNNSISTLSSVYPTEHKVTGTYKDALSLFGVDVFQAIIWVKYTHNGDDVLSVDGGNAYTGRNYSPLLDTDWTDVVLDYNSQKAWATADVTFSVIYKGLSPKVASAELGVQGDVDKNIEGWKTPL